MHEKRIWINRLLASDQIALTCPSYFNKLRNILLILSLCCVGIIAALFILSGKEYSTLIGIVVTIGFTLFSVRFLAKNIHSTLLKGNTLILTDLNKRSYVTSIVSLKSAKSYHFGKFQLTALNYKLDGIMRRALIVNSNSFIPFNTDNFLLKAKDLYKKKKANL